MLVKQRGGMIEFIPTPSEKRDGVIRNHVLDLLVNLNARIRRIEEAAGLPADLADGFQGLVAQIEREETHVQQLNDQLLGSGLTLPGSSTPQSAESR